MTIDIKIVFKEKVKYLRKKKKKIYIYIEFYILDKIKNSLKIPKE